jgi:iron complex outermembrane receptor protein
VGSHDYYQGQIDYNQVLNADKTLLFRLNADVLNAGSFRKFEKTNSQFIAPSLKWIIAPATTLSLNLEAYKLYKIEPGPIPEYQIPDPATGGLYTKLVTIVAMLPWDYNWAGPDAYTDRRKTTFTGILDHTFSPNLTTRLSFNFFTDNSTSIEVGDAPTTLHSPTSIDMNAFFQRQTDVRYAIRNDWNWKVVTGPLTHQLIIGMEHSFDDQFQLGINPRPPLTWRVNPLTFDSQPVSAFNIPPITDTNFWNYNTLGNRTRSKTTVDAIYVTDVISAFNGRLITLLGGRYDRLKQSVVYKNLSLSQTRSSPQISSLFKITPDISMYASYSTSIFPNAVSPQNQLFDPLKGIGKEMGFKFDLAAHRIVGTVSLFDIRRVNIAQANFSINPITGQNTNTTSSGGIQQARGWDSNWVFTATDEFQVVLDFLKTNPVFVLGRSGSTPTAPSPDQGLPTSRGLREQVSLWGKYTMKKGDMKGFSFGAGMVYIAPFRVRGLGLEGLPRDSLELTPASLKVDGSIGYETKIGNRPVKFSLTGQNLFNRRYLIHNSISPLMAPPRTLLLTVDFRH